MQKSRHDADSLDFWLEPDVDFSLTKEAEYWTVSTSRSTFRLRDSRGLQILSRLIAEPDREIHVIELVAPAGPIDAGDAGEVIDRRARAAYRRRLAELREIVREAEAAGDVSRAEGATEELEFLKRELSKSLDLLGRIRRTSSAVDRARSAVGRRVREAIKKDRPRGSCAGEVSLLGRSNRHLLFLWTALNAKSLDEIPIS